AAHPRDALYRGDARAGARDAGREQSCAARRGADPCRPFLRPGGPPSLMLAPACVGMATVPAHPRSSASVGVTAAPASFPRHGFVTPRGRESSTLAALPGWLSSEPLGRAYRNPTRLVE